MSLRTAAWLAIASGVVARRNRPGDSPVALGLEHRQRFGLAGEPDGRQGALDLHLGVGEAGDLVAHGESAAQRAVARGGELGAGRVARAWRR